MTSGLGYFDLPHILMIMLGGLLLGLGIRYGIEPLLLLPSSSQLLHPSSDTLRH